MDQGSSKIHVILVISNVPMSSGHISVSILAMALHSKCRCPMLHLQNSAIYTFRIMNKCCKPSTKRVVLRLGVVHYSLQADDPNTFHLICLSHAICDLHGLKQNDGYCWLYKTETGNNCNFTHAKITLVVLYTM